MMTIPRITQSNTINRHFIVSTERVFPVNVIVISIQFPILGCSPMIGFQAMSHAI
jgi:hypothetical protein